MSRPYEEPMILSEVELADLGNYLGLVDSIDVLADMWASLDNKHKEQLWNDKLKHEAYKEARKQRELKKNEEMLAKASMAQDVVKSYVAKEIKKETNQIKKSLGRMIADEREKERSSIAKENEKNRASIAKENEKNRALLKDGFDKNEAFFKHGFDKNEAFFKHGFDTITAQSPARVARKLPRTPKRKHSAIEQSFKKRIVKSGDRRILVCKDSKEVGLEKAFGIAKSETKTEDKRLAKAEDGKAKTKEHHVKSEVESKFEDERFAKSEVETKTEDTRLSEYKNIDEIIKSYYDTIKRIREEMKAATSEVEIEVSKAALAYEYAALKDLLEKQKKSKSS